MIRLTDFSSYVCGPELEIREVMSRMNAAAHQFQTIVDGNGKLLGTVTDGDIRRAILRGVTLEEAVAKCMHTDFITGRIGDELGNLTLLRTNDINFLPLLDADGILREALVSAKEPDRISTALVMAGGPGARLGERTRLTPKPLLAVGGRPILEHVLSGLEACGVGEVFISVHYLAEQIKRFVEDRENLATIHLIDEDKPYGTAGALSCLPAPLKQPVLIVNGDVITRTDYGALSIFHERHGHDATIAVARHDINVPFGVVHHCDDGLFSSIEEKPRVSHFVAAGIYYLSPEFCALVPKKQSMDMPELLNLGHSIGLRMGLFPIHEYWVDIGRPEDLETAIIDHGPDS